MVKVILGSLGALPIFDNLVPCRWLVVERNGVKFGPGGGGEGVSIQCIQGSFDS